MHDEFADFHQLEPTTPFLLINRRLRCVVCGKKNGQCRPETHGSKALMAHPVLGSPNQGPQPARRILRPPADPRRTFWPELGDDEQMGILIARVIVERADVIRAREQEVARQWEWLQDAIDLVAGARYGESDADAFRLLQHHVMEIGRRRVELAHDLANAERNRRA